MVRRTTRTQYRPATPAYGRLRLAAQTGKRGIEHCASHLRSLEDSPKPPCSPQPDRSSPWPVIPGPKGLGDMDSRSVWSGSGPHCVGVIGPSPTRCSCSLYTNRCLVLDTVYATLAYSPDWLVFVYGTMSGAASSVARVGCRLGRLRRR